MSNLRKVEVYVPGLEFVEIQFKELKNGNIFRLFEPTGEPVVWDGETEFVAGSDPYEHWYEADEFGNPAGYRWTIETLKKFELEEA